MFDIGGLAITAEAAQAAIIRGLEPLATASRVADRSVSLIDLTGTVRSAGFDEIADSLALRGSDVVASRQGAIDRLVADGIEPVARARALVDDATLVVRSEFDDPADQADQADQDAAYARFGDDIFDAGGSLIDDLVDAAGVCRVNRSFSADTLVALADGTLLEISGVQAGDQVLAWDLETGTAVSRTVTATLPHSDWLLEAHFSDGSVLEVTEDHRFWSTTDADWVELQDLDTTDVLLTPDGASVTVDYLDWNVGAEAPAWDLTVDDVHNFFVAADQSAAPVLVHNQTLQGLACGASVSVAAFTRIAAAENALDAAARIRLASVANELARRTVPDTVGGSRSLLDVFVEQLEPVTSAAELRRVLAGASFGPNVVEAALSTGRAIDILGHPRFVEAVSSARPDVIATRIATKADLGDDTINAVRTADADFANLGIGNQAIEDHWRAYSGALNDQDWLTAYVRIRKNSFTGSQFERGALAAAGVPVGTARRPLFDFTGVADPLTVAGRGGFVPDDARALAPDGSEFLPPKVFDHWRFVEVKNLNPGPINAGDTSNTASQLEWLIRQDPGPSGLRGELDLYVAENTEFTQPFRDLVEEAERVGVEINLFRELPRSDRTKPPVFAPDEF